MRQAEDGAGKAQEKAWLRREEGGGGRRARPVVLLGLAGTALAIGQAFCAAFVLAQALGGGAARVALPLAAFAVLALFRAALAFAADRAAFAAGAAGRRRLRTDALSRLLHAGPSQLRAQHSGELTATVVDRIEALDGLYSRWLPASVLAIASPVLVGIGALLADPSAALVLIACGLLVPIAMA